MQKTPPGETDANIRIMITELNDSQVLVRIVGGDLIAIEASGGSRGGPPPPPPPLLFWKEELKVWIQVSPEMLE